MSFVAALIAFVIGARALLGSRGAKLLLIAVLLAPLGVGVSMWRARDAPRTRVNFAFVGYRVPLAHLTTCGAQPDVSAGGGFWIGGGERQDGDQTPDVIAIPGFRPRLLQVCSPGTPFQAQTLIVRAVSAGQELGGQPSTGTHTQRAAFFGLNHATTEAHWSDGNCLLVDGVRRVPKADIVKFAEREWRRDVRQMPLSRARVRDSLRTAPPDDSSVYCVDFSGAAPQRCTGELSDPRSVVFLWRSDEKWVGLPPEGVSSCDCETGQALSAERLVTIPLHTIRAGEPVTEDERRELPGLEARMISRRSTGGRADLDVPRPASTFAPAPYRLGTRRQIKFARSGTDLLVFVEEPQVQLREDDLFGREIEGLPQGELDVVFGNSTGREVLLVDLAAAAEGLLPKPVFGDWVARISIDKGWQRYIERSTGSLPRGHRLGEIATFGTDARRVRPLVLVERVLPPRVVWVVPLAAALLAAVGIVLLSWRRYRFGVAWDVGAIALFLLTLRWMLSTRVKLDMPGNAEAQVDWIVSGATLFVIPPFLIAVSGVLARFWRAFHDPREKRSLTQILRARGTPPKDHDDRLLALGTWTVVSLAATGVWVALACTTARSAAIVGWAMTKPILAGGAAACFGFALAIAVTRLHGRAPSPAEPAGPSRATEPESPLARFDEAPPWKRNDRQRAKKRLRWRWRKPEWREMVRELAGSWTAVALLLGLLMILVRLAAMSLGSQEQIFGNMRTDVFFLPAAAAALAALSRQPGRNETERLVAIVVFFGLAYFGVGATVNDLGLIWVGGLAIVLCLPFVSQRPRVATVIALGLFFAAFLSPKVLPGLLLKVLEIRAGPTTIGSGPNQIELRDDLQVQRDRDHYRMLDTVRTDIVERIPSQLAREIVLDRERVRYQATHGAWRDGLRSSGNAGSLWLGSGYLQSKPIVGNATFRDAARSDYVYPLYIRSELGLLGLAALVLLYATLFAVAPLRREKPGGPTRLGLWSLGTAAGTALFMIGGTSSLYPFSGKWPLLLSVNSSSDLALGLALLILGAMEAD